MICTSLALHLPVTFSQALEVAQVSLRFNNTNGIDNVICSQLTDFLMFVTSCLAAPLTDSWVSHEEGHDQ